MAFNPFVHLGRVIVITGLLVCQMRWMAGVVADIQEYCGKDGKTHCVPVDDDLDPKEVLHCGNCGLCSNT